MQKIPLFPLALALTLTACANLSPRRPASSAEGQILHIVSTTDLHGYLEAAAGGRAPSLGGADVMAGFYQVAKAADPETLFLDSGDLYQGTILSNSTQGAAVVTWMNYIGYTASAIGNHDFDFGTGLVGPLLDGQDSLAVLKARMAQAKFPFLGANICSLDEDAGQCADPATYAVAKFTQPYMIQTVHGVRVGIIGLATPTTPSTTSPGNVKRLRFLPLEATLERFLPIVKAQADVVIVIVHEGGFCNGGHCTPTDPIFRMVDALSPATRQSIALVLAGHTHGFVNTIYNGLPVMINGSYGRSFGYISLQVPPDGPARLADSQSVDLCAQVYPDTLTCTHGTGALQTATFLGHDVAPDPKAFALIAEARAKAKADAERVVGRLLNPVVKANDANGESSLGELMADAYRLCGSPGCTRPADVAFQNNTGIRSPSFPSGPVTFGEVFNNDPFDDYYAMLSLSGRQIHDLIDAWYRYAHGTMPQVSGLRIRYRAANDSPRTLSNAAGETQIMADPITSLLLSDGTPLDENKTYTTVMSDFLAAGGSGSDFVLKGLHPEVHFERFLRDALVDYLLAHPKGLDYRALGGRLLREN